MSDQETVNEAVDVEGREMSRSAGTELLGVLPFVELEFVERRRSPWDIAEEWYGLKDIANGIQQNKHEIPADVQSEDFAKWLTHQYRLAMAKGIQLGREGTEDRPCNTF